ncbi:MAG: hypothetical protein CHKLHMKO_00274 [Candidatus Argoarchaeum ethanivorans]|uniref:Uncharacterized protein n=1 Tax=Candidatus Argoarchaeum ethanivorans TaxID=2608793 RepID=A0A811T800_9EURY|nr:MAG: hypothetical protein CHKLHMKO_00274 [Candidatus Argoarchaeum ethanivorans]
MTKVKIKLRNLYQNFERSVTISQRLADIINEFEEKSKVFNSGEIIPVLFDTSETFLRLGVGFQGADPREINTGFILKNKDGKKIFAVFLANYDPLDELTAAHEIMHYILYTGGFSRIKRISGRDGDFETLISSFAQHFAVNKELQERGFVVSEEYDKILSSFIRNPRPYSSVRLNAILIADHYFYARRTVRRRLIKTIRKDSELYREFQYLVSIVKDPSIEKITPYESKSIMKRIAQDWGDIENYRFDHNPLFVENLYQV